MNELDQNEAKQIERLRAEPQAQFARLYSEFKERLKRIIHFRLDYRVAGRVSDSDILQECFVRASKRLEKFLKKPDYPFFVWLRMQANQQVADIHRKHLMAEKRDARKEINLNAKQQGSNQTSMQLAAHLVAQMTSPSRLLQRSEEIAALESSLNEMNETDREVIALRHFEELSSQETAQVLGIEPAAASKRYVRALKRLQEIMSRHGFSREES